MTLTIHRGTHEIGGICIEIRTEQEKILIDFGMPLDYGKRTPVEQAQIHYQATEWCKDVDALFLSHAHADHYGFLELLPEGTPVYASEETFAILALDGIFGTDPTAHLKKCQMQGYKPYEIGGLTVTAYPIDHSAYGALSMLFDDGVKRILYSGDIRLHGVKGILYKHLPQDVDYLLLDGTNIVRFRQNPTESEVETQFVKTFEQAPDALHLVWCSSKNIDRICTIFRACIKQSKQLVVDPFVANVLADVAKLNPKIPSVATAEQMKVYFPTRHTSLLMESNKEKFIYSLNPQVNKVSYPNFAATPGRYVMIVRPKVLEYLRKIKVEHIRFVKSIWRGYWDDPSTAYFRKWVESNCEVLPDIHSSGHADIGSLRNIVDFVKPKHLIPIHTDSPEYFGEHFPGTNVLYLEDNLPVCI